MRTLQQILAAGNIIGFTDMVAATSIDDKRIAKNLALFAEKIGEVCVRVDGINRLYIFSRKLLSQAEFEEFQLVTLETMNKGEDEHE